jgi:hypothetical protein
MTLEPVLGSEEANRQRFQQLHESFVRSARDELMEHSIVVVPSMPLETNV